MIVNSLLLTIIVLLDLKQIVSQPLSIQDQEPRGVHLVYCAETTTQMNIIWWTKVPVTSAIVYYSLIDQQDESLPIELIGCNNDRIEKGYLARNATMGKYIHRVLLKNLLPNRRYCYEITSGHASSHIFSFRTAALSVEVGIKDDNYYHTNFVVNGNDLNYLMRNKNLNKTVEELLSFQLESIKYQLNNKQINAFVNLAPLGYDRFNLNAFYGQTKNDDYNGDFLDYYSGVLSNMPIMPTIDKLG